jgi:hypothetical protein
MTDQPDLPDMTDLPEGYEPVCSPEETFNREEFESDPLAWVDRNRGF